MSRNHQENESVSQSINNANVEVANNLNDQSESTTTFIPSKRRIVDNSYIKQHVLTARLDFYMILAKWLLFFIGSFVISIKDVSASSQGNLASNPLINRDSPPRPRKRNNLRLHDQSESTTTFIPSKRRIVCDSYIEQCVGTIAGVCSTNTSREPVLKNVVIFKKVDNIIPINNSIIHSDDLPLLRQKNVTLHAATDPVSTQETPILLAPRGAQDMSRNHQENESVSQSMNNANVEVANNLNDQSESTTTFIPSKRRIVDNSYIKQHVNIAGVVSLNTPKGPVLKDVVVFNNVYDSLAINKAKLNDLGSKLAEQSEHRVEDTSSDDSINSVIEEVPTRDTIISSEHTKKQQNKNVRVVSRIKSLDPNVPLCPVQVSIGEYSSDEDLEVKRHNTNKINTTTKSNAWRANQYNTPKIISDIVDYVLPKYQKMSGTTRKISGTENQPPSDNASWSPGSIDYCNRINSIRNPLVAIQLPYVGYSNAENDMTEYSSNKYLEVKRRHNTKINRPINQEIKSVHRSDIQAANNINSASGSVFTQETSRSEALIGEQGSSSLFNNQEHENVSHRIGQDNTHCLPNIIIEGAGNTINQALDLGAGGKLIADSGITDFVGNASTLIVDNKARLNDCGSKLAEQSEHRVEDTSSSVTEALSKDFESLSIVPRNNIELNIPINQEIKSVHRSDIQAANNINSASGSVFTQETSRSEALIGEQGSSSLFNNQEHENVSHRIGQDNTHCLPNIIIEGAGNTINQALDLGAGGKLIADSGITDFVGNASTLIVDNKARLNDCGSKLAEQSEHRVEDTSSSVTEALSKDFESLSIVPRNNIELNIPINQEIKSVHRSDIQAANNINSASGSVFTQETSRSEALIGEQGSSSLFNNQEHENVSHRIGHDNTHCLPNVIIEGAGNTINQALDLGAGGKLIADSGITDFVGNASTLIVDNKARLNDCGSKLAEQSEHRVEDTSSSVTEALSKDFESLSIVPRNNIELNIPINQEIKSVHRSDIQAANNINSASGSVFTQETSRSEALIGEQGSSSLFNNQEHENVSHRIGQDNTHCLPNVIIEGAGNTINQALDLEAGGKLIADSGITDFVGNASTLIVDNKARLNDCGSKLAEQSEHRVEDTSSSVTEALSKDFESLSIVPRNNIELNIPINQEIKSVHRSDIQAANNINSASGSVFTQETSRSEALIGEQGSSSLFNNQEHENVSHRIGHDNTHCLPNVIIEGAGNTINQALDLGAGGKLIADSGITDFVGNASTLIVDNKARLNDCGSKLAEQSEHRVEDTSSSVTEALSKDFESLSIVPRNNIELNIPINQEIKSVHRSDIQAANNINSASGSVFTQETSRSEALIGEQGSSSLFNNQEHENVSHRIGQDNTHCLPNVIIEGAGNTINQALDLEAGGKLIADSGITDFVGNASTLIVDNKARLNDCGSKLAEQSEHRVEDIPSDDSINSVIEEVSTRDTIISSEHTDKQQEKNVRVVSRIKSLSPNVQPHSSSVIDDANSKQVVSNTTKHKRINTIQKISSVDENQLSISNTSWSQGSIDYYNRTNKIRYPLIVIQPSVHYSSALQNDMTEYSSDKDLEVLSIVKRDNTEISRPINQENKSVSKSMYNTNVEADNNINSASEPVSTQETPIPNTLINFSGSNSSLVLTNSGTLDRLFTPYNALTGNVLFSSDGSLVASKGVDGSITTSADNIGTITIGSDDVGVVGVSGKSLKQINLNQPTTASISELYANNVSIGGAGPITATGLITAAVNFSSNGNLIADKGITGDIGFVGNEGVLKLSDSQTITGKVDSSSASAGTLEFLGNGTITGAIGATNAGAVVTAIDALTGNVTYSASGTLNAESGITGDIDFANQAGTLNLANGKSIVGTVDGAGTLGLGAGSTVTGSIGGNTPLAVIKFTGSGATTVPTASAGTYDIANAGAVVTAIDALTGNVTYSASGTLNAESGITGDIDFANQAGTLNLANGKSIVGTVDGAGTLGLGAGSTVTGSIGGNTPLAVIKFTGSGATTVPTASAGTYDIANAGAVVTAIDALTGNVTYSASGTLNAESGITGDIDFANQAGTLNLANGKSIVGTVDGAGTLGLGAGSTVTGSIGGNTPLAVIKFTGSGATTVPTASVGTYDIANAGAVVTAIDALTGNVTYSASGTLNAESGITGDIDFANQAGTLNLANGKSIVGTVDGAGTLGLGAGSTVTGSIGGNTPLAVIKFTGSGATTVPTASAGTYDIANAGAVVTAIDALTGNVTYSASGTLNAESGITGDIDFANQAGTLNLANGKSIVGTVDGAGTLGLGAGSTVTGSIGGNTPLAVIKFTGSGATTVPTASVGTYDIANAGAVVTAIDALTGNVTYSASGTLNAESGITGDIDFANQAGTLNLANGKSIVGTVDGAGTLGLGAGSTVTGSIGGNTPLAVIKFTGSGATTVPTASAGTYDIANAGAVVTAIDALTGNVTYSASGTLNAESGITGDIDFANQAGTLNLANGKSIVGTVDGAGTLGLGAGSTVTGSIGSNTPLAVIKFTGSGATTVPTASVGTYDIANAGAVVTAIDALTGNVTYSASGTLNAESGITGDIDFANQAGTLNLANGKSIVGTVDGAGTLGLGAGSTVTGSIGGNTPLAVIKFTGSGATTVPTASAGTYDIANAGAVVTAIDALTGNVTYSASGTLNAESGITGDIDFANQAGTLNLANGKSIVGTVDGAGTLGLGAGSTVTGSIGGNTPLAVIKFTGSGATTVPTASVGTYDIANAGAVVTAIDALTGNVTYSASGTLNAESGITGDIDFANQAGTLNLANGKSIVGTVDGAGTLGLGAGSTVTGSIGGNTPLAVIKFTGSGATTVPTASAGTYDIANAGAVVTAIDALTGNITYSASGTLNAESGITGDIDFANQAGTLNLANGKTITGTVKSIGGSNGILNFLGSTYVTGNIGTKVDRIKNINFTGNNTTQQLGDDIYGETINFSNNNIVATGNTVVLSGTTNINGNINLKTNHLVLQDNQYTTSSWGTNTSITTTMTSDNTLGTMDVQTPVNVASTVHVIIDDQAVINPGDIKYLLINTNGGNLQTNFTVSDTAHPYINWVIAIEDDKNVYLYCQNTSSDNLPEDVRIGGDDQYDIRNVQILADSIDLNVLSLVHDIGLIDGKAKRGEAVRRVANNLNQHITNVIDHNVIKIHQDLTLRVSQLQLAKIAHNMLAVGSGDEVTHAEGGAWATPFYSNTNQKERQGTVGYNAKSSGGILGVDIEANDNLIVGAAFSIIDSKIKYKQYKSGDITKTNSKTLSLYGAQQLTKGLFIQAIASYSYTNVKNKEYRLVSSSINPSGYQIAKSNYDITFFSGEILAGYNKTLTEQLLFTPMVGINYARFQDDSYQESGTTYQNKMVSGKSTNRTEAKIGTRFSTFTNIHNLNITPEVRAFISHRLSNKGGKVDARLDGMTTPFITRSDKNAKTMYNLGLGINTLSGCIEYGANFDSYFGKKYTAYHGSLKVRVKL